MKKLVQLPTYSSPTLFKLLSATFLFLPVHYLFSIYLTVTHHFLGLIVNVSFGLRSFSCYSLKLFPLNIHCLILFVFSSLVLPFAFKYNSSFPFILSLCHFVYFLVLKKHPLIINQAFSRLLLFLPSVHVSFFRFSLSPSAFPSIYPLICPLL